MKKIKVILFAGFILQISCNPKKEITIETESLPILEADSNAMKTNESNKFDASFPGGIEEWYKFISTHTNKNVPMDNNAKPGKYTVIINFIVSVTGDLKNVIAETKFGYGMEEEAIRVVKSSPKWVPAQSNGIKIISLKKQPITFLVKD